MIAIAIVPENFNEILKSSKDPSLLREDLEFEHSFAADNGGTVSYFVPEYIYRDGTSSFDHRTIPAKSLENAFDYVKPQTPDRWFEITHK